LVSAGADRIDRHTSLRLKAQGSASFIDRGLFLSNSISDSFGVVDTNGLANVRVMDENRAVGRTDASGQLLLPDLRSFDINHISLEPTEVAMVTAPQSAPTARPPAQLPTSLTRQGTEPPTGFPPTRGSTNAARPRLPNPVSSPPARDRPAIVTRKAREITAPPAQAGIVKSRFEA